MSEKTTELALRTAAENTAEECGFMLVDSSVYPDTDNVQYVYVMEIDRVPQDLSEDEVRTRLEKHLAEANPIYAGMIKNGLIKPAEVLSHSPRRTCSTRTRCSLRATPSPSSSP